MQIVHVVRYQELKGKQHVRAVPMASS